MGNSNKKQSDAGESPQQQKSDGRSCTRCRKVVYDEGPCMYHSGEWEETGCKKTSYGGCSLGEWNCCRQAENRASDEEHSMYAVGCQRAEKHQFN